MIATTRTRRSKFWLPMGTVAAVMLAAFAPGDILLAQPGAGQANRTEAICRVCHAAQFESLQSNPHRALDQPAFREQTGNAPACLDCHGDVSAHIAAGGGRGSVFAFRDEPPLAQTEVCQGCHAATHPEFDMSAHAQAGLSCASCHTQHQPSSAGTPLLRQPASDLAGRLDRAGARSALCADCHESILTAFGFNERHRLREGILECTSCHDPHAPLPQSLLGALDRDVCVDCHEDKRGPFVFEHPVAPVEGCTACHDPHGSPNRHLLAHQQTGELCLSCHASLPQFHVGFSPVAPPRFGTATQCTNCHSAIHGSNLDRTLLR